MAVFLTENGVLSMGNKTPVTILQETLQRQGITPHYDLIYNGVGTLDPVFKYEVRYRIDVVSELSAIGSGKTKKAAKHDAAAALLKRMQSNRAVTENEDVQGQEQVDIASPYSGELKQNYVGMLEEVCVVNKVPIAVFTPTSEAGPPHARIFTMKCQVGSCSETAVARTKKQAKHMAAQKMITRLTAILGDDFIPPADKSVERGETLDLDDEPISSMHFKAIESGSFRHDLSIPISKLHNVFFHRTEEFLTPQIFLDLSSKPEEYLDKLDKPKQFLDELLSGLEGICKVVPITNSVVTEAMDEWDNIANKFSWGHYDDYSSDECLCDQVDVDPDENEHQSNKPFILEEFDLGNVDKTSLTKGENKEKENLEVCREMLEELFLNNSGSNDNETQRSSDNNVKSNLNKILLSVICPQGQWAFSGTGPLLEDAVNTAAIAALKFFRTMSISCDTKDPSGNERV